MSWHIVVFFYSKMAALRVQDFVSCYIHDDPWWSMGQMKCLVSGLQAAFSSGAGWCWVEQPWIGRVTRLNLVKLARGNQSMQMNFQNDTSIVSQEHFPPNSKSLSPNFLRFESHHFFTIWSHRIKTTQDVEHRINSCNSWDRWVDHWSTHDERLGQEWKRWKIYS